MSDILVSSLSIYPVKSCREIKQKKCQVDLFGLKNDRRWMVVDEKGVMLTQRKLSRMCLIQPELIENHLILKHSEMKDLRLEMSFSHNKIQVKVWDDLCMAYDAGNEAASWLSEVLSCKCRLVYFPEDEFRQVDLTYAMPGEKTAFSDGFPLLLISQASLDDLNQRLVNPITMNRFRPNLVVQGCKAFAEDDWHKIQIGNISFRIVKPCSRCVIPGINIETAVRESEPTKTLAVYRKKNNKIFFGQNVIAEMTGEIKVGMAVEIIE